MPQRIEQIKKWLISTLQADIRSLEPASSDASFRRYFRVSFDNIENHHLAAQMSAPGFIIMDAPPAKEDLSRFIKIASYLEQSGVSVPHLFAVEESLGFILMSDLGTTPYLSLLSDDDSGSDFSGDFHARAARLYTDAMNALLIIQQGPAAGKNINLPAYDPSLLQTEMELLPDWYINVHLDSQFTPAEQSIYQQAMKKLIASAQAQPQVFVHRDYHSRNLMFLADQNPGIIDFQDAVIGPVSYDLVSLLRDSYIAWPEEQVYRWVEQYRQMLLKAGILKTDDPALFIRWFDWMGVQRQLKVVGIFARLNYRDGKSNYLNDIPLTLEYLLNVCARYEDLQDLYRLLSRLTSKE